MELLNDEQAGAPGAGVLSVSLKETGNDKFQLVNETVTEQDNFWNLISEELAKDGSPVWRMWR